jgi:DHA1 family bicyclomycin/chloramphenicol resistance-like MFS transporter
MIGEREFVAMMGMLQALQALAIDSMLPALGVMARDLSVADSNQRQLVVGAFLLGSGAGSLLPGTLSDRFGRKPVLLACIGSYLLLSLACAFAANLEMLVGLRFFQAVFCSGMVVIPAAIIRDSHEGNRMARMQSLIGVVFMIVPMLAPLLGQLVLIFAGWRWIFGVLAAFSAMLMTWSALRLPETMRPEHRQPIMPKAILANMGRVFVTRPAIGYILATACTSAVLFGFINSAQQLIAEHFGAHGAFGFVFGGIALAMAVANFGNSRIVLKFGARRVSHAALFIYILLGATQLFFAWDGQEKLWQFMPLMMATFAVMGFMTANFTAIAIQPFARTAGAAASVHVFLRMLIGAALGAAIGQLYDGTAKPLAGAMLLAGFCVLALVLFSERARLFGRSGGE